VIRNIIVFPNLVRIPLMFLVSEYMFDIYCLLDGEE